MRWILGIALTLSAATAMAQETMSPYFGNTVISKGNGPEVHTYYNADGTVTGKIIGMKLTLKGTWKVDGDQLCLTYTPPPPTVRNPICVPNEEHKIGDTWMSGKRTVTLVQGIQ
ncbi:MAG TPA: hypothetical protein VIM02_14480 [Rhizomicrobium sp.]|jgi:hypothetical protein